eukprot:366197-Chlamydomonas_euryale.AAC.16
MSIASPSRARVSNTHLDAFGSTPPDSGAYSSGDMTSSWLNANSCSTSKLPPLLMMSSSTSGAAAAPLLLPRGRGATSGPPGSVSLTPLFPVAEAVDGLLAAAADDAPGLATCVATQRE